MSDATASFDRFADVDAESPTLVEGLPGHGLVASIAVDQVTDQLGLEHYGSIHSAAFPPVLTFEDGRSRDAVRVYGGEDPPVLTLQSDVSIPPEAFDAFGNCVMSELAEEFERAIFLAGAPADSKEQVGEVTAVATDDRLAADLRDADVPLAEGNGVVGGVTGALAGACHEGGVPAAVIVVRANPHLPDPGAAKSAIENALEPLVDFEVDTTELEEQAEQIRHRKQQIAEQLKQRQQAEDTGDLRMYR